MKRRIEEYLYGKSIGDDGGGRYLIGDDIEGCLRAARNGSRSGNASSGKKRKAEQPVIGGGSPDGGPEASAEDQWELAVICSTLRDLRHHDAEKGSAPRPPAPESPPPPLSSLPSVAEEQGKRRPFTEEEDAIVVDFMSAAPDETLVDWGELALKLRCRRKVKQIRDRWYNHLDPQLDRSPFSREDDLLLWDAYRELGSQWAEISAQAFRSARSGRSLSWRWTSAAFREFVADEFGTDQYEEATQAMVLCGMFKHQRQREKQRKEDLPASEGAGKGLEQRDTSSTEAAVKIDNALGNRAQHMQPIDAEIATKITSFLANRCKVTNQQQRNAPQGGCDDANKARQKNTPRLCSQDGCTNQARFRGGFCKRHRARNEVHEQAMVLCEMVKDFKHKRPREQQQQQGGDFPALEGDGEGSTQSDISSTEAARKIDNALGNSNQAMHPRHQGGGSVPAKQYQPQMQPKDAKIPAKTTSSLAGSCQTIKQQQHSAPQDGCDYAYQARKKKTSRLCSKKGCTNQSNCRGGFCNRHRANCRDGFCIRHRARNEDPRLCSQEGCTTKAYKGIFCRRHGSCSQEGCTTKAYEGFFCRRHGRHQAHSKLIPLVVEQLLSNVNLHLLNQIKLKLRVADVMIEIGFLKSEMYDETLQNAILEQVKRKRLEKAILSTSRSLADNVNNEEEYDDCLTAVMSNNGFIQEHINNTQLRESILKIAKARSKKKAQEDTANH